MRSRSSGSLNACGRMSKKPRKESASTIMRLMPSMATCRRSSSGTFSVSAARRRHSSWIRLSTIAMSSPALLPKL